MTKAALGVRSWLGHIDNLAAGIGPRGSTTEAERRAAEYSACVLQDLGLRPEFEGFLSARSIYQPQMIAAGLMLLSFAVYPLLGRGGAIAAAGLAWLALISDLLELSFRSNLLRWLLPKAPSQNVVAVVPPAAEHQQDLVLIGHLDSHRSPLIFSSAGWVAAYKAFTTVAFVAFLAQAGLYTLGIFWPAPWIWPATLVSALCALLLIAMCLQADSTPFSAGANDNATGAGLVLTLAERLRQDPLRNTRVWLLCSGCEEVQHYGAIDFFRRHLTELRSPRTIAFEMLGCAGPAWLVREGIVVPFHADAGLLALAERLAKERPELEAYPGRINGGNTEMADALRLGIPAITLMGLTRQGGAPFWHQPEDTVEVIDAQVLGRAYEFTWAYLRALDSQGA